jgi:hypothetical protein
METSFLALRMRKSPATANRSSSSIGTLEHRNQTGMVCLGRESRTLDEQSSGKLE